MKHPFRFQKGLHSFVWTRRGASLSGTTPLPEFEVISMLRKLEASDPYVLLKLQEAMDGRRYYGDGPPTADALIREVKKGRSSLMELRQTHRNRYSPYRKVEIIDLNPDPPDPVPIIERPTWVAIELRGVLGERFPHGRLKIRLPSGDVREERVREDSSWRADDIPVEGTCYVTLIRAGEPEVADRSILLAQSGRPGMADQPTDLGESSTTITETGPPVGLVTSRRHVLRVERATARDHIEIVSLDERFAPTHEPAILRCRVDGEILRATVEIRATGHDPELIFSENLGPQQLREGEFEWQWSGEAAAATTGPLHSRFVNPLFAPYSVSIRFATSAGERQTASKEVWVEYHSLKLKRGAWTPDEETNPPKPSKDEAERGRFLRYALNKLGYWAGPVVAEPFNNAWESGSDADRRLGKALSRYLDHHPRFTEPSVTRNRRPLRVREIMDAAMDALVAGQAKQVHFEVEGDPFSDPAATATLYVELLWNRSDVEKSVLPVTFDERPILDEKILNRPMLPIEVEVHLTSKQGKPVWAPHAVGPVRVNWKIIPQGENLARLEEKLDLKVPNAPRTYIAKVHQLAVFRGAGATNCPARFGGLLGGSQDWASAALLGQEHAPYTVESDPETQVVFSKVHDDPGLQFPHRSGCAGFMFHPSFIGGDAYRIEASLDFRDRPNAKGLQQRHRHLRRARSGVFTVWRRSAFAEVLWPFGLRRSEIEHAQKAFDQCYVRLEVHGSSTITAVLSEETYRSAVDPSFRLHPGGLYGGELPPQEPDENGNQYWGRLGLFWVTPNIKTRDSQVDQWLLTLSMAGYHEFQRDHPGAVTVVGILSCPKITFEPRGENKDSFDQMYDKPAKTFFPGFIAKRDLSTSPLNTLAHELGHAHLLMHSYNETGGQFPIFGDLPTNYTPDGRADRPELDDHDRLDGCLMSYFEGAKYFCGKCNLRLRGWAVKSLPSHR